MSSPILVVGALGNVGAEVVKRWQAEGCRIRAADIDEAKIRERFVASVEAVRFDFLDPKTYKATFKGVEKMFLMRPPHITSIKRDMNPSLEAAKRAGVKHVIFLSLIGIENAKFVPHYKVEKYLNQMGVEATFLRCSFFMQNLSTTHRKERKERSELFVPAGSAKAIFIDAPDICAVAAVTLTQVGHTGKSYDLTGSEALDYWQATNILSEVLGRNIVYRNPNPIHFIVETMRRSTQFMFALVMMGLYTSTRIGIAELTTGEVEKNHRQ